MGYIMGKAEGVGESWHGHVSAVTVAPEFRRMGLARTLMCNLEEVWVLHAHTHARARARTHTHARVHARTHGRPALRCARSEARRAGAGRRVSVTTSAHTWRRDDSRASTHAPTPAHAGAHARVQVTERRHNAYFVDLFVRVSNSMAISMYEGFGYIVYRCARARRARWCCACTRAQHASVRAHRCACLCGCVCVDANTRTPFLRSGVCWATTPRRRTRSTCARPCRATATKRASCHSRSPCTRGSWSGAEGRETVLVIDTARVAPRVARV